MVITNEGHGIAQALADELDRRGSASSRCSRSINSQAGSRPSMPSPEFARPPERLGESSICYPCARLPASLRSTRQLGPITPKPS